VHQYLHESTSLVNTLITLVARLCRLLLTFVWFWKQPPLTKDLKVEQPFLRYGKQRVVGRLD
jgi:hypothetical protein